MRQKAPHRSRHYQKSLLAVGESRKYPWAPKVGVVPFRTPGFDSAVPNRRTRSARTIEDSTGKFLRRAGKSRLGVRKPGPVREAG